MLVAPADVRNGHCPHHPDGASRGRRLCIVASLRPSVDEITGVIKANIPARIAFQVAAKVNSRTILDGMDASKLLGKGDMLYLPPGSAKLIRAQGALVTDGELQQIVNFIAKQGKPSYEMEIHQQEKVSSGTRSKRRQRRGRGPHPAMHRSHPQRAKGQRLPYAAPIAPRLHPRGPHHRQLELRGIVGPRRPEPRDILIDLDGGARTETRPLGRRPPLAGFASFYDARARAGTASLTCRGPWN